MCVTVVVGATGGCGATTLAVHLARAFARRASACLVEACARAGAAERLGLDRDALRTWRPDRCDPEGVRLAALPMAGGWRAAFAPKGAEAPDRIIATTASAFDRVVVDVGPCPSIDHEDAATILVVAASLPAVWRARSAIAEAGAAAIVLNRTGPGGECSRRQLEAALGARVTSLLPHCPSLRASEDTGTLLRAGAGWARRVDRLAVVTDTRREAT